MARKFAIQESRRHAEHHMRDECRQAAHFGKPWNENCHAVKINLIKDHAEYGACGKRLSDAYIEPQFGKHCGKYRTVKHSQYIMNRQSDRHHAGIEVMPLRL